MSLAVDLSAPVQLVRGDDPVLLADTVIDIIDVLVGDGDRSMMLDEFDAGRYDGDNGTPSTTRTAPEHDT